MGTLDIIGKYIYKVTGKLHQATPINMWKHYYFIHELWIYIYSLHAVIKIKLNPRAKKYTKIGTIVTVQHTQVKKYGIMQMKRQ